MRRYDGMTLEQIVAWSPMVVMHELVARVRELERLLRDCRETCSGNDYNKCSCPLCRKIDAALSEEAK